MTSFWWLVGIGIVAFYIGTFKYGYSLGKEDGIKTGYAKGRKDVNAHLDAYRKNGGWSA